MRSGSVAGGGEPMSWARRSLYHAARVLGDVDALASGNPKRILRRAKNKLLGRLLGKLKIWR